MESPNLTISKKDYDKLIGIVMSVQTETAELLEDELNRAEIVNDESLLSKVVSMDSVVSFVDESSTNNELTIQLVYPNRVEQEGAHQKVSILAPVGAALIGLKIGQSIDWPLPNGKTKRLKVTSVKNEE